MKNSVRRLYLALLLSTSSFAIEKIEAEAWLEYSNGSEYDIILQGLTLNISMTEHLGLVLGSGIGIQNEEQFTAKDLAVLPKVTFTQPQKEGLPGFAFMGGVVLPTGHNFLSSPNTALLAIGILPWCFFDDAVKLETHLGYRRIYVKDGNDEERLHWGVYLEADLYEQWNLLTNIYTGSPLEIDVPTLTQEYGLSYAYSDTLSYDFLFGTQPELDGIEDARTTEYWGQIGARITFSGLD